MVELPFSLRSLLVSALDETNTMRFLPTYLCKCSPPREVADRRIVERFSRNDDGGIVYGYTVEDADYTDSYSAEVSWRLTDKEPYEFACHEGNHAMIGILAGARQQEMEYREKNGL